MKLVYIYTEGYFHLFIHLLTDFQLIEIKVSW